MDISLVIACVGNGPDFVNGYILVITIYGNNQLVGRILWIHTTLFFIIIVFKIITQVEIPKINNISRIRPSEARF